MSKILTWAGWMIAAICFILLCLQRSCSGQRNANALTIHDTITVKGDRQLIKVQDTVLKPYRIVYHVHAGKIDTAEILKKYFAKRIYYDTVKAKDVTAVIEDSISADSI